MKILVCIKQVPPTEEFLELNTETKWLLDRDVEYRINRFDEFAMEEALLIKESLKGTTVDVISVGPDRVETALRRAMGMGADNAIHIKTEKEGFTSPLYTAELIGSYAKDKGYNIIFTGIMSEDAMQSIVGPSIASNLNIPCAAAVVKTSDLNRESIEVKCELEGGRHQVVKLKLPALITVQSGINTPRYPSLSNMLRANKQKITVIEKGLGFSSADEETFSLSLPKRSSKVKFLEGTAEEKAEELLKILGKKGVLKD